MCDVCRPPDPYSLCTWRRQRSDDPVLFLPCRGAPLPSPTSACNPRQQSAACLPRRADRCRARPHPRRGRSREESGWETTLCLDARFARGAAARREQKSRSLPVVIFHAWLQRIHTTDLLALAYFAVLIPNRGQRERTERTSRSCAALPFLLHAHCCSRWSSSATADLLDPARQRCCTRASCPRAVAPAPRRGARRSRGACAMRSAPLAALRTAEQNESMQTLSSLALLSPLSP